MKVTLQAIAAAALLLAAALPAQRPKSAEQALANFAKVRDADERARHGAVYDLGRFDEDDVTAALLGELKRAQSISYRRNVVRALGYKQRKGVLEPLRDALLAADNPRIADACGDALRRQGDDGVSTLAATLPRCSENAQRNAICYALGRVSDHAGARDALLQELRRASGRDRLPALRGLAARAADEAVDEARVTLAGDGDALVAATALGQLADHGHARAPELAMQLHRRVDQDADEDVQTAILRGLLAAPTAERREALFARAARAKAPFGEELAPAWRAAMTAEACAWVAAEAQRTAAPAVYARALAFAPEAARDGARKALATLLAHDDEAVAGAAATTLAAFGDERSRELLRRGVGEPTGHAECALAALHSLQRAEASWAAALVGYAEDKRPAVRAAALRALADAAAADAAAASAAERLLADRDWRVRAAAYQLLAAVRAASAPPLLIARIDKETGRLRQDVLAALRELTGASFADSKQWKAWWAREKASFQPRPRDAGAPGRPGADATTASYWNIPVHSDRVTFVVDCSGSMAEPFGTGDGTRLDEAKRQLGNVFDRIPKKARVNVISFGAGADALFDALQPLSGRRRKEADAFVAALPAKGPTNVHAALRLAFADAEVDTIFLLTDGRPSVGAIVAPGALADEVQRWNLPRGLRIHTIAIGEPSDLLERLARDSGGEHTVAR